MKKIVLLLVLIAVIMAGCDSNKEIKYANQQDNKHYYRENAKHAIFVIIDSCEYIVNREKYAFAYTESYYETYTHKGNCLFCKERREKEIKEIIELLKEK